ncbi:MAG: molybdate ABC transporter permease subunit [Lentisphaeraceae bacterium]|nr:molybdate ABC transporter permease subunit [Lentisphaeraceae bacterium]
MISHDDLIALWTTLKLAIITTILLLLIATPLAWWISNTKWKFKFFLEALFSLPLVLPPTVLGFYLLLFLGSNGPLSHLTNSSLAFSFYGLVFGSIIYSFPFVIQPLINAFNSLDDSYKEIASTLRAKPLDVFFSITLPMVKPSFITAAILGFAHTLGEFGVVLMIGGNIPGVTRVASIAIYDHVEMGDFQSAHVLSAILLIISFSLLVSIFYLNQKRETKC